MRMGVLGRATYNSARRARVQRREIVPAFERLGGLLTGCRVLEVGAGRGGGAELLLDVLGAAAVDAVDLDPIMTRLARDRLGGRPASVLAADTAALPFPDGAYDAAVDFGGIHLADDWRRALAEIARVLRPGGRFYFEQPLNLVPRWTVDLAAGGRFPGGFAIAELLGALDSADLAVVGTDGRGVGGLDLIGVARKR